LETVAGSLSTIAANHFPVLLFSAKTAFIQLIGCAIALFLDENHRIYANLIKLLCIAK
jgi:hypothetical protein